jgi:signal transduction histidine kinase
MIERIIVWGFGLFRLGVILQVNGSLIWMASINKLTWTGAVLIPLLSLWSIVFFGMAWRRHSMMRLPACLGWFDMGLTIIAMALVELTATGSAEVLSTWQAWTFGYAAGSLPAAAGWLRSPPVAALPAIAIGLTGGGTYVAAAWVVPGVDHGTLLINSLTFVIFSVVPTVLVAGVRQLAISADQNRRQAIAATADLERTRYQFHTHNVTGLLTQLARVDTPADLLPALRSQAIAEANRLRRVVLHQRWQQANPMIDQPVRINLRSTVVEALRGFAGMPIESRVALIRDVEVSRAVADGVALAIHSLLYNVQFHAQADTVVVHADRDDNSWVLTVTDDGVGFDPASTEYSFGLRSQVIGVAQAHGLTVEIISSPGQGTSVSLRGSVN